MTKQCICQLCTCGFVSFDYITMCCHGYWIKKRVAKIFSYVLTLIFFYSTCDKIKKNNCVVFLICVNNQINFCSIIIFLWKKWIYFCSKHRCPHRPYGVVGKSDQPCAITEYRSEFVPREGGGMRESFKPEFALQSSTAPLADETTHK